MSLTAEANHRITPVLSTAECQRWHYSDDDSIHRSDTTASLRLRCGGDGLFMMNKTTTGEAITVTVGGNNSGYVGDFQEIKNKDDMECVEVIKIHVCAQMATLWLQ